MELGDLQSLHETYFERGLRVVAVTFDPTDLVRRVMKAHDATFWIGVDPEDATLNRYAGEGSVPMPRYYLVDVEGVVLGSGKPDVERIERELRRVFDPALGRTLHGDLEDALKAYARGAAGLAWKRAGPFLEADDEVLAADALFLREKVERFATWQRDRVDRRLAAGQAAEAMGELLVFQQRFDSMDVTTWAAERIAELEKLEAIHADRFAWQKLEKALAKEAKGVGSRGKRSSVLHAYRKVVKSHPETVAARIAAARIAALEQAH